MLYKHQAKLLKEFPHKQALVWEMGSGKTLMAIELAKKSGAEPLFICPKGLKENWYRELEKHFQGSKNCTLLTKEEFKRDWRILPKHDAIVVDEAHHFFGMTSDLSKALLGYLKKYTPEYLWLLTATPYRSSPWDIYRMAEILGHRPNYWAFRERFFQEIRFGRRRPIPVIRKDIEADIGALVASLSSIVELEECVDVPAQTFLTEYFALTPEQKSGMLAVYDVMPIVRYTKYHQICGGTLKSDGYEEDQFFPAHKFDRLMEILNENSRAIVVCRYNAEVEMIQKILRASTKRPVVVITGAVGNRQEILDDLKKKSEYVLVVNASCSEGWELPECPLMVFYSYSFSLKDYLQMLGRIQRINNIKKNVYLSLVVKDSIDEEVYKAIERKEDFIVAIYESTLIK